MPPMPEVSTHSDMEKVREGEGEEIMGREERDQKQKKIIFGPLNLGHRGQEGGMQTAPCQI